MYFLYMLPYSQKSKPSVIVSSVQQSCQQMKSKCTNNEYYDVAHSLKSCTSFKDLEFSIPCS
jgi:hypothetical protein